MPKGFVERKSMLRQRNTNQIVELLGIKRIQLGCSGQHQPQNLRFSFAS
jgi:hypothetical protein